jgi:hypothetical protein
MKQITFPACIVKRLKEVKIAGRDVCRTCTHS